ncbi:MAG: SusE domain-containing protein, partial [Bacteroidia bacterium]|nr:SusE domain-containing protein [Bacteroidia bacterium]
MKRIKIIMFLLMLIGFNACQQNDDVVFISGDSNISFSNTFLNEYLLSFPTSSNIAERFTWNSPDVGVPTNLTYSLEVSLSGDFADASVIGSTSANELAVTVGDMLGFASQLGLDNDPATENPNT